MWIDTVRLARDFGTVSELFPDHVDDLRDLPHTLFDAVRQATIYIGFDELEEKERPPKRIWQDNEKLTEWFDEVKRNRRRESEGDGIEDPVSNAGAEAMLISG